MKQNAGIDLFEMEIKDKRGGGVSKYEKMKRVSKF